VSARQNYVERRTRPDLAGMRIRIISGGELSSSEKQIWSAIQLAGDRSFSSPYLCPEFTEAVAAARDNIFVGIMEDGNAVTGFFPFHLREPGVAGPAIQRLADYEGVIVLPETQWTADELLCGCGLREWRFEVLIRSQTQFHPHHRQHLHSPIMDLSRGFAGYANDILNSGSRLIAKIKMQHRWLERDHGPVRYEAHVSDITTLAWLMVCKSGQYRRTVSTDHFKEPWFRKVLERVHATQGENFAGMLSVLYAGDQIVAAHLGLRSRTAWHYWFPCYDSRFAKYSPGSILLIEMAKSAQSLGLRHIDLGRGLQDYKLRFQNGSIQLAAGTVAIHGRPG
jgi:CelD/BcsL family acetyltransferase involved in cellulose biosynthesis